MRVAILTLVAAAYTGLATACSQKPVGTVPSGNPITAPVLQVVEAGKPFAITWTPTTPGTVSIVLLRGPAENVIPIDCLGDNIPNTGTFSWTPATSLEADVTGYGLQIIVTGTGQFQYSTQFGISNANPTAPKPSASASASGSISQPHGASAATKQPDAHATDSRVHLPTTAATLQPEGKIHTPAIHVKSNATTSAEHAPYSTSSRASLPSSSHVVEAPIRSNATVVAPSKSVHGPVVSLQTSLSVKYPSGPATGTVAGTGSVPSATNVFTGDAGRMFTQGGIVGLFSIVVAALL